MKKLKLLISAIALSFSAFAQHPTSGLTGFYKFENANNLGEATSGANLQTVGFGVSAAANYYGTAGKSVSISSSSYLYGLDSAYLSSSVTIAAWIYVSDFNQLSANSYVAGVRHTQLSSPYNSYALIVNKDSKKMLFSYTNAGVTDKSVVATTIMNPNTWYHLAATYDAATHTAKIYVNGILESSSTEGSGNLSYSRQYFEVGNIDGVGGNYYTGRLDELFVYNRALTEGEIAGLMNSVVEGTLVEHFKFDGSLTGINGNKLVAAANSYVADRAGNASKAYYLFPNSLVGSNVLGMPQGNSSRTISLWFKRKSNTTHTLFSHGTGVGSFSLVIEGSSLFIFNGQATVTSRTIVYDTLWHHVAVTHSGATTTMYYDNVAGSPVAATYNTNSNTARVGRSIYGGDYISFVVDDLQIHKVGLSATEIAALYNAVPTAIKTASFKALALSPNPSQANITVSAIEKGVLNIYSMEGKLMLQSPVNEGENTLNIADLPAGMYMATVVSEGTVQRTQFIKE